MPASLTLNRLDDFLGERMDVTRCMALTGKEYRVADFIITPTISGEHGARGFASSGGTPVSAFGPRRSFRRGLTLGWCAPSRRGMRLL